MHSTSAKFSLQYQFALRPSPGSLEAAEGMAVKLRRVEPDEDCARAARAFVNKAAKAARDLERYPRSDYEKGGPRYLEQPPWIKLAIAISMLYQYNAAFWPSLTETELGKLEKVIPQAHFRWFTADDEPDYAGMIQGIIDWCSNPQYEEQQ